MKLRAATEADLEILAEVHALAFEPGWSVEEIADLGSGPGVFALIVEDSAPLGMILCRAIAGEAEILTLAVAPQARRRGVARALVEAAAGAAQAQGAESLFLEVAVDNDAAVGLYRSAGFEQVGLRPAYYRRSEGVVADALVMRRDLNTCPVSPYPDGDI